MYKAEEIEKQILEFWDKNQILNKIRTKNKGKKKFYFLQGPPYTSGNIHLGQAWNNSMKDFVLRYKRMCNFDVWDRAGYDMHGLPTDRKVQAKLNLKDKEDIIKFGIGKYNEECMKFSIEKAEAMSRDLKRLGVSMNFDDPYYPIKTEFIEGEWFLIKKAHEKGRLYEGEKTITWCASCATALAKHECEYREIKDNSIYVKLRVDKNKYLIIWTTTPWTLAFNLAVMVNPNIDYVKCEVEGEEWIIAKDLAESFFEIIDKPYRIIEEFKGKKLEGLNYEHPWVNEIKEFKELKKKCPKVHTVILSEEYVDTSSGTGLVHCAPGCGPEDYEVGHRNGLPPFNDVNEYGIFSNTKGIFSGLRAKKDDEKFIEALGNNLVATKKVVHDYAHCERCKEPVIFRTTKQWFFKIEDLKNDLLKANKKINWYPKTAYNAFESWLENLRDNSITKQRYWGTPVPIWKCDKCKEYTVIGSVDELKKYSNKIPENLHRPWIDEVTIKCKCGGIQKRIPDILDVWLDAGTASWNCLYYPKETKYFEELFPADFILEGKDQIRGWFNVLMVCSAIALGKTIPFKNCYMHGFITDVEGVKMSKSLGNIISPNEVLTKYGADVLRAYTSMTPAGEDMNFSWEEIEVKSKNLTVLYNLKNYLINYADGKVSEPKNLGLEEEYMLSKLNSSIVKITEAFENYELDKLSSLIDELFLELSRVYIQMTRERAEERVVINTVYHVLLECLKLMAPVMPFISESIYQDLRKEFGMKEESIHMMKWPKANKKLINPKLEEEIKIVLKIIADILAERTKNQIGVRWPLRKVVIYGYELEKYSEIIKRQTNLKEIIFKKGEPKIELDIKLDSELEREGFARELMRNIQALRKKAGLIRNDKIELSISSDYNLKDFEKEIKEKVGAKKIHFEDKNLKDKSEIDIKGKKFKISLQVV